MRGTEEYQNKNWSIANGYTQTLYFDGFQVILLFVAVLLVRCRLPERSQANAPK